MSLLHIILILTGLIIIGALGWYAWSLTSKVKEAEKRQQEEEALAAANLRAHQKELITDIQFVARSVLADQCEITEGVLRINYLVNALDPETWSHIELTICRKHYDAVCNMPILDAYQKLSKKEQFRLDKQRWQLEDDHKNDIQRELRWLSEYHFPNVTLLH
ncbi:MAG: hypothetical protein CMI09_02220 [Oceanospirillaceae bacterium]|nr:hypothetical protein [Oceanospirillaceae bacterium]|tara:strand:+ start:158 stop:643 length:486 start_codon:yes stop_codon:yes gene_type:complete